MDTGNNLSDSIRQICPPLSIPARSVRKERRCAGNDRNEKNKADTEHRSSKAEEVKICDICGEMIIGEYDYVRTKRRTELYFHKGMSCKKEVLDD